jgi:hypothetical protein
MTLTTINKSPALQQNSVEARGRQSLWGGGRHSKPIAGFLPVAEGIPNAWDRWRFVSLGFAGFGGAASIRYLKSAHPTRSQLALKLMS